MSDAKKTKKEIESYISDAWESGIRFSLLEVKAKIKRRLTSTPNVLTIDPATRRHSIILVAEAGVGKSTVLQQVCDEIGAEYATYHHGATVVEDNHGLQVVDQENGSTKHVVAEHMLPFKREPKGGIGVFLIDEAANGSFTEHEVVLRMFIDGQCDEHKVKPGWLFVCASNPPTAKYSTVRQPDFSLEDRFLVMPVEVSNEEKLAYWSGTMPATVYKFLLMHKLNRDNKADFISMHSSRRWSAMAYDVEKDVQAGGSRMDVVKSMRVNMGSEIATAFDAFLQNGDNPDKYPMNYDELLFKDGFNIVMRRIKYWLEQKDCVPLLGATQWDLGAFVANKENHAKLDEKATKRLVQVLVEIGTNGHSDLVDDLLDTIARTQLCAKVIPLIEETKLADHMLGIMAKIAKTDSKMNVGSKKP